MMFVVPPALRTMLEQALPKIRSKFNLIMKKPLKNQSELSKALSDLINKIVLVIATHYSRDMSLLCDYILGL